jgi:hypothetical protein
MTHFETLLQNSKGGSVNAGAAKLIYYQTNSQIRLLVRKEININVPRTLLEEAISHLHEIGS